MPIHQHVAFNDRRWRTSLEGSDIRLGEFEHGVVRHVLCPFRGAVVGMRGIKGSD
jgi:hypothetical protein